MTVEGVVVRLSRDHHYGPGVVVIEGIADDSGALRRYHVELVEKDYNEAFRAHGEGLRVVARGDLATRGSYKWLRPARSFAIIPGLEGETLLPLWALLGLTCSIILPKARRRSFPVYERVRRSAAAFVMAARSFISSPKKPLGQFAMLPYSSMTNSWISVLP